MKLYWIAAAALLTAPTACSKKKSSAEIFSGIGATREAHKDALLARCKPAFTSLTKPGAPLTGDTVTGVPALHASNAAVLLESWASWLEFYTNAVKTRRDISPALDEKNHAPYPEFDDICSWVLQSKETPEHAQIGSIPDADVPPLVDKAVASAEAIHYIVAIHIVGVLKPKMEGGTFTKGIVSAEARVFDDKGADHGAFRFAAESSDKVEFRATKNKKTGETRDDSYDSVDADLTHNAKEAFAKTLAAFVPGSDLTIPY